MKLHLSRDIIHSIGWHNNWREEQVHTTTCDWVKFMRLFLLGLGGSFFISSGIPKVKEL